MPHNIDNHLRVQWLKHIGNKILVALIVLTVLACLFQFGQAHSLWLDEVKYAQKIKALSYSELINPQLNQSAEQHIKFQPGPFLFFVISKCIAQIFGYGDLTLKAIPLIAGLLSLWLFYLVSKKLFSDTTALGLTFLMGSLNSFIYYTQEFHPYITDVLISTLIAYITLDILKQSSIGLKSFMALAILGVLSQWISIPAMFTLAGLALILLIHFINQPFRRFSLSALSGLFLIWLGAFAANYIYLKMFQNNLTWVETGFLNGGITMLSLTHWINQCLITLFKGIPFNMNVWPIGIVLLLTGMICAAVRKPLWSIWLITPLLLIILASALNLYPFRGRLLMFALPIVLWLFGFALDELRQHTLLKPVFAVILTLVISLQIPNVAMAFAKPMSRENLTPILKHLSLNRKGTEPVYVYYGATRQMQWYCSDCDETTGYIFGNKHRDDYTRYETEIDNIIERHNQAWFVFTHILKPEYKYIQGYLNQKGTLTDQWLDEGRFPLKDSGFTTEAVVSHYTFTNK